jgi:hypothetical protein
MRRILSTKSRGSSNPSKTMLPDSSSTRVPMVSTMARGCSKISFCMKCLYPPFSAMTAVHEMVRGSTCTGFPARVVTRLPSRETTAIWPSSSATTRLVYSRIAGISLAMKFSPSP